MSVRVKICGITSVADMQAAVAAGADLIGLMFHPDSPRYVSLDTAREVARVVPPFVGRVGVFVNPPESDVWAAITACQLTLLQFHGDEPPEFCTQFGLMCIKAFRPRDVQDLAELLRYPTDAWLVDAWSPAARGGTGTLANWELAVQANQLGRPIFLAGGLTPENVAKAVRRVRPFGVDVSSGVERAPGQKDPQRMRAFVAAAKSVR